MAGHAARPSADRQALVRRHLPQPPPCWPLIPYMSAAAGAFVVFLFIRGSESLSAAVPQVLASLPLAALAWFVTNLLLILATTRLLGMGLTEGYFRVRSRIGWQVWATERVLDLARDVLFPIYASLFTPVWLRLLGAKVGKNVEASTVLLLPKMTTVGEGAFLADDTMVASYELGGGWMRIAPAKIGKRSFLGNSGMTAAGTQRPQELAGGRPLGHPGQGQVRHLLAGQPARAAAAHGHRHRQHPDLPAAAAAEARARPVGAVPVHPGGAHGGPGRRRDARLRLAGRGVRLRYRRRCWAAWWSLLQVPWPRPAPSRPNGCWWAGSGPASTPCGVPSSGGTRWWIPSSKWSAPRGSPARPRERRPWSGGCGAWARRSAAARGARATGCPKRIL